MPDGVLTAQEMLVLINQAGDPRLPVAPPADRWEDNARVLDDLFAEGLVRCDAEPLKNASGAYQIYPGLRLTDAGRRRLGQGDPAPGGGASSGQTAHRILEVLIASPSDTADARDAVEDAILRWNSLNAIELGVALIPRRWERDGHAEMGGAPQHLLNRQIVDRSHILIGVFWTRLGTRTDDADSGTVEEIARFMAAGKPTHLYFSDIPVVPASVDPSQLTRLNEYKDTLKSRGLLGSFSDLAELRQQVQIALTNDVRSLADRLGTAAQVAADPDLQIRWEREGSGRSVTVSNGGTASADDVRVSLEGGLFMLNNEDERIGEGFKEFDAVGTLTPGSERRYKVLTAAQTDPPRVTVTASGCEPITIDLG